MTKNLENQEYRQFLLSFDKLRPNIEDLPIRYRECAFNNFVVHNPNWRVKLHSCKTFEQDKTLLITGQCGTGKTHLAIATARNLAPIPKNEREAQRELNRVLYWKEKFEEKGEVHVPDWDMIIENEVWRYRPAHCLFLPATSMMMKLSESALNGGRTRFFEKLKDVDVVILDDLGAERLTEATRQNFYTLVDARYSERKGLIITSNYTVEEIHNIEPRIPSRLSQNGDVIYLDGADYRLQAS